MKYKIILSDYDGTLCDQSVSYRTIQAIKEYEKRGGKFIISSGRSLPSCLPIAKSIGLNGYIMSYNGASLYDMKSKKELITLPVDNEKAIEITEFFEKEGFLPQLYIDNEIYTKMPSYYSIKYEVNTGLKINYTCVDASQFLKETKADSMKILIYVDPTKTDGMAKKYNQIFGKTNTFFLTQPYLFECVNNSAGKGNMAKKFCEMYNIDTDDMIVLGDSNNDVSMLKVAGLKVAMGNAVDELKEVANYITDTAANDGVAKVIEKFCLEE